MATTYKSDYAMRIVYLPTGEYVQWAPGQEIEAMVVDELCDRVAVKGVGVGRTSEHVLADVRAAMTELILDLKKRI